MIVLEIPPIHILLHVLVIVDELHLGYFGDLLVLLVDGMVRQPLDLVLFSVIFL